MAKNLRLTAICDNPPRRATPRRRREADYYLEPERLLPILNQTENPL
jgi:hypothetical protein